MLSVAEMVRRAGSLLIMGGGIMETSLSLVSLTRGDLVSFHCVFSKCAIKVIMLEAYQELSFITRKLMYL